jgi:antitoxin ParD1/3/4
MSKKNTSITLGEKHLAYVQKKVESGEFSSVSDVVRDALRRSEERDLRVAALERALQEGLDSGPPEPFDINEFLAEMHGTYKGSA